MSRQPAPPRRYFRRYRDHAHAGHAALRRRVVSALLVLLLAALSALPWRDGVATAPGDVPVVPLLTEATTAGAR